MTRAECEGKILDLLQEIEKVYNEFVPNGKFLTLAIRDDGYTVINKPWGEDEPTPLICYRAREE